MRKGDRVPLLLPRGIQFIVCALGVMKCGAAYVPLDPSYPPERLRRMLEGLEARIGLGRAGLSICNGKVSWLDASLADELSSIAAPPRQVGAEDPAYVMFTSGSTGRPKGVEVPHRAIVRLVFGQDFARMGPAGDMAAHGANLIRRLDARDLGPASSRRPLRHTRGGDSNSETTG